MQTALIFFVVVTAVAVVLQMAILAALYAQVRKSSARVEKLAEQVPPDKLGLIVENLASSTSSLKSQIHRLDATLNDLLDRTRLQVIRADEMVTRAMDRVEETTEIVQHTVVSPIRQGSALLQGVLAGVSTLFGGKSRTPRQQPQRGARVAEDEELFI